MCAGSLMASRKKPPAKQVKAGTSKEAAKPKAKGRPSLYKPEYAEQAYKLCLLGATDAKLADFFAVNEDTVHEWKKVHTDFSESITRGKEQADAEIAEALFHRAKGYSHPEDDIRTVAASIVITPTVKHYPPDTQAASLWLRNRQPALWRDKQDVEHSGNPERPVKVDATLNLTPAEVYKQLLG